MEDSKEKRQETTSSCTIYEWDMEITQGGKSISFSGKQDLYWLENKNWSEIEEGG